VCLPKSNRLNTIGRMNARAVLLVALVAASLVLAGCGSKGPLYLPDKPSESSKSRS
jgi:predicted small lipoprotein YifL